MKKNLTMKDIAKLAGVSQPTVSRVVNGNPTVDPEVRERVEKIILQQGFKPNSSAKTLRSNSSKIIGVILFDLSNYYYLEMIKYVEKAAGENGYTVIILNSQGDKNLEKEHILNLQARNVDGIIIAPVDRENLEFLKKQSENFVVIDSEIPQYPCIFTSLLDGGKIAAQYLYSLNHKKIAFIGADKKNIKLLGIKEFFSEKKMKFLNEWFIETDTTNSNLQNLSTLLDNLNEFPTAFITSNDVIALNLTKELEKRGLNIPKNISILSFDDTIISTALNITSIKHPVDIMMTKAIDYLLTGYKMPIQKSLNPILIKRESCTFLTK
ncbi:LacI family transcriptional regulator [Cetobacterium somerae]|uniref:LacI family DNA-binding transcriptional regulator n=1 Tax=Cetobacterium sp. NK01 TaxID=2993530 RepID=UPI002116B0BD|nr:LacI family DNA-binding transcriptional regulator [Cetobacterium sp. NK01]MCQ8212190.1 LacI family transcriptional regulator [Cetobacterium sp. NK01]